MSVVPGVSYQMRGDLKPQKADEVTLGVNGALGKKGSFRVDGVYRTYSDFYATSGPDDRDGRRLRWAT